MSVSSRPGWLGSLGPGLTTATYLTVTVLLALVPARLGSSLHQAQFSGNAWQLLAIGLGADAAFAILALVVANAVLLLGLGILRRRWPSRRAFAVMVVAATSAGFLFVLVGSIAAAEFKIERGIYPTTFDLRVGMTDTEYARSALGTFFLKRFVWSWLIALALFIGLSVAFLGRVARTPAKRIPVELGRTAFALTCVALSGFGLHRASPHLFASIANWRVVESPFTTFFRSLGSSHENVRFGFLALIDQLGAKESDAGPGAELLGLPPGAGVRALESAKAAGCASHPLADSFDSGLAKGNGVNAEFAARVARALDELSRELMQGRTRLRIWHVSLESMRADDVSALNPKAPANLTPVVDGLYAAARAPAPRVIVARRMYQAGVRTSQALAASLCGVGTMPLGISFTRDLGLLPLRCLPDILKDAGFALHFYYGSNPAFDAMQTFLQYHGFDHLMTEKDYVERIRHEGWAVPDDIVLDQSVTASNAAPKNESQYNLVMTLTNHHPFDRPAEFPSVVEERVRAAVAKSGRVVGADDLERLDTFSYLDYAFGRMLARIEATDAATDTLVVAGGDHSTGDYLLWRDTKDSARAEGALARVPFAIVLPEALVAASQNPSKVRDLVAALNVLLEQPISQNDVPRLILGLVARSSGMQSLPERQRWHNLGGQALSPHFRVGSNPTVRIIGFDASSRLFWLADGDELVDPDEPASTVFEVEAARTVTPTLGPEVSLLASFSKNYSHHCWDWSSIRAAR